MTVSITGFASRCPSREPVKRVIGEPHYVIHYYINEYIAKRSGGAFRAEP